MQSNVDVNQISNHLQVLERLRNDNTTATQRNDKKGDFPLISQLQVYFFTIRESPALC